MFLHHSVFPVQHKEEDGEADSSQQSQTNCEAQGQHIWRQRNITVSNVLHAFICTMQFP